MRIPVRQLASQTFIAACAGGSLLLSHISGQPSLADSHSSSFKSNSSNTAEGGSSKPPKQALSSMPVLETVVNATSQATGKASRLFHGSMMVEGELMSTKKPMSPFSGQEVTSDRLPTPLPDPYANEPDRPSTLNLRTDCPYTAEPDMQKLISAGYITPNELHYVRNHLPAPVIAAEDYVLTIEGPGLAQIRPPQQQHQQHQQQQKLDSHMADLYVGGNATRPLAPTRPRLDQAAAAAAEAAVVGSAAHNEPASTGLLCQEANMTTAAAVAAGSSSRKLGKVQLKLSDLEHKLEQHTIVATLQCAGNRRNDLRRFKEVKGGPWEAGGIATSAWTGPWLRDVLTAAGVDVPALLQQCQQLQQHKQQQMLQSFNTQQDPATRQDLAPAGEASSSSSDDGVVQHVWFEGYDNAGPDTHFLVSIPLDKALADGGDVMLALKMNGQDIPGQHGYPVRVVVPGHVGTRSCKWLKRIVLSDQEAPSHWQQTDYKMLPPNADWQVKANWQSIPAIQAMPVQSAILSPIPGSTLIPDPTGHIEVQGYAWSGGGSDIVRVEVTADGGKTWVLADLQGPGFKQPDGRAWGWVLWKARVPVLGLSAGVARVGQEVNAALGAGVHAQNPENANDGGRGLISSGGISDSECRRKAGRGLVQVGSTGSGATTGTAPDDGQGGRERVVVLQCKAVDSRYNTQPSDVGSIWNIRGCGCNNWHTVEVTVQGS